MLELLHVNPGSGEPIYRQLSEQIIHLIVGGQLPEETVLPSVRQMAEHLAVNPMTVSRAVKQLVEQGWLERRRGQATRVAQRRAHQNLSAEAIIMPQLEDLLATAQQLGLSQQGLQQLIVKHWPRTKE
ncbi:MULTISPECIES: GntR family transcriptional regulator [Shewanella]|jgi:GntR family transcriptional regulator|uniref:GntR family transcriptional regulator n=1 Tax=Shewanella algae TaxID=38313 RepID=A0A5N5TX31_9GAMM|nr:MULTISPECIES: GntR family transcriptional regulator [Shewanella]MBO2554573.1 GntR family transcriptional regulator [Shewanella algae]MBO2567287.1 GntR family transcriptional regulator [Shewanella algae]MBO2584550.1 GntR family transcriptional regulator [Shewanella algae]MBO2593025.1 GntR family transcriptional regulator [Shewanella algae]MBO2597327.1 GntR family transcriptional regulator [Shewanella algae]